MKEALPYSVEIEALLKELAESIQLINPGAVRNYFLNYFDILDVIPQAVNAAKNNFPEAQLVMDIYQDPEIPDYYLVLYIRPKNYDDSVIEWLEKAEEEFIDKLANKRGWIQLTTDFRKADGADVL